MVRLYHGTTSLNLDNIQQHGLQPRRDDLKSTFKRPTIKTWVYLTDDPAMAMGFAEARAIRERARHRKSVRPVVLEVDVDPGYLVADDDYVYEEGLVPGSSVWGVSDDTIIEYLEDCGSPECVEDIYEDYESNSDEPRGVSWKDSLEAIHTVAHFGPIMPDKIKVFEDRIEKPIKIAESLLRRPREVHVRGHRRRIW